MSASHAYRTIKEAGELIKSGRLSSRELTRACLERIEELNPKLNAFITVMRDQALAAANRADAGIRAGDRRGPLQGIPVALKDMYDTAGVRTTAAFKYFADRIPRADAVAVAMLQEAGAVIVGKTNMHELAMGTTATVSDAGAVHNPWNADFIAGGSSGGSAVAVASAMCFATVDTDAIGSTRLPAACCGVVGYKCTWGLIDNTGILAGEPTDEVILKLATVGIQARLVEDVAVVADTLTGSQYGFAAAIQTRKRPRIGVVTHFAASDDARAAFAAAVKVLEAGGHQTIGIEAPFEPDPDMKAIDAAREHSDKIFGETDLLVLPTLADNVPRISEVGEDPQALSPRNTFFANYFGLPAISVPCGTDKNGLPIGLQIVGRANGDADVLRLAAAYQDATTWSEKHPDL